MGKGPKEQRLGGKEAGVEPRVLPFDHSPHSSEHRSIYRGSCGQVIDPLCILGGGGGPGRACGCRDCDTLTVQLGVWSIRAMLEAKTVGWTLAEVLQQIKWMREVATGADQDYNLIKLLGLW